jgi:hypothetical protein
MVGLQGVARTDSQRCVIDAMGGTTHNYRYCIKPPPTNYMTAGGPLSMANVGKVVNEITKYVDYLIVKPDTATRDDCYEQKLIGDIKGDYIPVLGNKYVLKTGLKCIPVNPFTGKTICNPADNSPIEKTLYKYINNVSDGSNFITGGGENAGGNGLLPSIAGNIGTLATNIVGVANSFSQESKPYCMEVQMSCHIVGGPDSVQNYSGPSPGGLFFSLADLREMKADAFAYNIKPIIPNDNDVTKNCISGSTFRNINENTDGEDIINIINKNIINQNDDKLIFSSNIEDWMNINNSGLDFNDSTLVKTYYLGLSLLMILIMFKMLYGKQKLR